MRTCDQNIAKLKEENKQREGEIERKRKQLKILESKSSRIEQQKNAVQQYMEFLEEVKAQNGDEYAEANDIQKTHKTLDNAQNLLISSVDQINNMLEQKKNEVVSFERNMETKIMSLNNDIANLTVECDEVEAAKSALQSDEEETSAKKWEQVSELSQVIFAIEMIE